MPFDALKTLEAYLKYPSVSTDPAYAEGMAGARGFLKQTFEQMGLVVEEVPTPLHAVILAEKKGDPSWPHIIIYGHYDVQPPEPLALWDTPPFEPSVRGGHLFARGAADNKGPLMAHIAAVARLLEEDPAIPLRLTFMIEGEEETGSPSFSAFMEAYKERLKGDFVLLSDTQSLSADQIAITTGLRGLVALEVELSGPRADLHSGLHGGAVRNPIQALVQLLATLHTSDGWVNIPGFYDAVEKPTDWECEQVKNIPQTAEEYRDFLGVSSLHTPPGHTPFEAIRFLPTLEYNGITGGYQGIGSKTIIPSKASVKITARLVPGQKASEVEALIIRTIEERLPEGVTLKITPHGGGDPYGVYPPGNPASAIHPVNEPLHKAFLAVDKAIQAVFGLPPVYLKEGGSIPIIAQIKAITGMDSLMIGLCTPESSIHAPNENFDLSLLDKGAEAIFQLLQAVGRP